MHWRVAIAFLGPLKPGDVCIRLQPDFVNKASSTWPEEEATLSIL